VKDYNNIISKIHNRIGVKNIPHTSFKEVFESKGCVHCGGDFAIRDTDCADASTVLVDRGLKFKLRPHFYCEKDKIFTLGYGGFNPCQEISKPKDWVDDIPKDIYDYAYDKISDNLGEEIAQKFSENDVSINDIKNI
jgi:hypothetical protein